MSPERRKRIIQTFINLANNEGNEINHLEVAWTIANQSRFYGEYYDIKNGIRSQNNHPHHPLPKLKEAMIESWKLLREQRTIIRERLQIS